MVGIDYVPWRHMYRPCVGEVVSFVLHDELPAAYFEDDMWRKVYVPEGSILRNWHWGRIEVNLERDGEIEMLSFREIGLDDIICGEISREKIPWLAVSSLGLNRFTFEKFSLNHK